MNIHLKKTTALLLAMLSGISLNAGISQSKPNNITKESSEESVETSVLRDVIQKNDVKILEQFFENNKKINLNQLDKDKATPLYCAIEDTRNLAIVTLLVEKGADVNFAERYIPIIGALTPLVRAVGPADKNDLDIVFFLVDQGADTNVVNCLNWFPLQCALGNGFPGSANVKMFKLFAEQEGADLDRIVQWFPRSLQSNPKIIDCINHVKNYYKDRTVVTKDSFDQNGMLIDPEVIPNYLALATVKKDIAQMNSFDVSPDFNLKNYIIRMQLRKQDEKIIKELLWIYLKGKGTAEAFNEIAFENEYQKIDKTLWRNIVRQYNLFKNNKMKRLHDTHFLYN